MQFVIHIAIFVSTYIAISNSNPDLKKGELMETIITKQTQGNYEEAISAFIEIGKLAKVHTIELSEKEQKLFFDCYEYRRAQLLNAVVDSEKYLDKDVVKKMLFLINAIKKVTEDLEISGPLSPMAYNVFKKKLLADKIHFEAWYSGNTVYDAYDKIKIACQKYQQVLNFRNTLPSMGYADLTILDATLGYSMTMTEFAAVNYANPGPEACDNAKNGLELGRNASSAGNPDLVPLATFIDTHCKPNPPNMLELRSYKKRE